MQCEDFKVLGKLVATSILQGGVGFPVLLPAAFHYICNDPDYLSKLVAVPDPEVASLLNYVRMLIMVCVCVCVCVCVRACVRVFVCVRAWALLLCVTLYHSPIHAHVYHVTHTYYVRIYVAGEYGVRSPCKGSLQRAAVFSP